MIKVFFSRKVSLFAVLVTAGLFTTACSDNNADDAVQVGEATTMQETSAADTGPFTNGDSIDSTTPIETLQELVSNPDYSDEAVLAAVELHLREQPPQPEETCIYWEKFPDGHIDWREDSPLNQAVAEGLLVKSEDPDPDMSYYELTPEGQKVYDEFEKEPSEIWFGGMNVNVLQTCFNTTTEFVPAPDQIETYVGLDGQNIAFVDVPGVYAVDISEDERAKYEAAQLLTTSYNGTFGRYLREGKVEVYDVRWDGRTWVVD